MKLEFTRAEIEAIILDHIRNEIVPYIKFVRNPGNSWGLPETISVETEDAAQ
jgi:hypothetical protein